MSADPDKIKAFRPGLSGSRGYVGSTAEYYAGFWQRRRSTNSESQAPILEASAAARSRTDSVASTDSARSDVTLPSPDAQKMASFQQNSSGLFGRVMASNVKAGQPPAQRFRSASLSEELLERMDTILT